MKCVNLKLWEILGCFHYILNAPRTLPFYILTATNYQFHCERDEEDIRCSFKCNVNGWIENLYGGRSNMLISIFKYLFYTSFASCKL